MKVGILTQPLHKNYGGLLQNYALQQVLLRMGLIVETIDQQPIAKSPLQRVATWLKEAILHIIRSNSYSMPAYQPNKKEVDVIRKNTNAFIEKYIQRSPTVNTKQGFEKVSMERGYDAFVVGSDQCWRPNYNAFLSSMFLDFTKNRNGVKRISYAASFGTDVWEYTQEQTKECAELIKKFDLVTVRENSGVYLCKKHFGVDSIQVLDPTLLLTKEDYISIIESCPKAAYDGLIFEYILDPTEEKTSFINKACMELNTTSFQVLPKCQAEVRSRKDVKERIEDCIYPGVEEWLQAFNVADMTIVDSFHGMVFSILFNKPFWVIANKERGNARFSSLLELFGLEDRLVNVDELKNVDIKKSIDWVKVNELLMVKRRVCMKLLLSALMK